MEPPVEIAVLVPALVGIVSGIVAAASWRALRQTGNRRIGFVVAGFSIFAVKSGIKAWHLSVAPESVPWEIALSLLDLVSVLCIAWPVLTSWGRRSP